MELSVVIPAYNEEDRIVTTLKETFSYLSGRPYPSEVIVVSDGSTDGTRRVAESLGKEQPVALRVIEYHPNRGKGFAVREGMRSGRGRVRLFMDADYSVPIAEMEKGLLLLKNGCDIAIGSRAMTGSRVLVHQNSAREISARLYTLIQNRYLGISYPDTQCGFKLFTGRAAQALFNRQKLESVIFDPEILWLAKRLGLVTREFPVSWSHVGASRIRYDSLRKSIFVFQELFRIKRLHRKTSPAFSDV